MSRKRFSRQYNTYTEWLRSQPKSSKYAKRIARLHECFPTLNLKELSQASMRDCDLSRIPFKDLTAEQRRERNLALEVLRNVRSGERLKGAVEQVGISKETALRHLGKYLYKSRGYWRAKPEDRIQVKMPMYARGEDSIRVVTTTSRDRSRIGKYLAAVGIAVNTGDASVLKPFENKSIVDAAEQKHIFETDLDDLYDILEAQREPEFQEIYVD